MSGPENKNQAQVPEWQKAQLTPDVEPEAQAQARAPSEKPDATTLEQARKFLQDPEVQKETPERKATFLKSKGIPQGAINELLKDEIALAHTEPPVLITTPQTVTAAVAAAKEDRPPIVTYPEFLTKPTRPPPLMTVNGFLNTLYAFGGVSALIYGTSKFVLEPMVESLTEARIELHDTANQNLTKLVEMLENTVSEIPPTIKKGGLGDSIVLHSTEDDDTYSSYDDPTELFHRDIGVQTSPPSSPLPSSNPLQGQQYGQQQSSQSIQQASRLTELVSSLKAVHDGLVSQMEDFGDIRASLDVFKDELDVLSSASAASYGGGYSIYGGGNRNEPDDEIKKAKENIRRVKGVLLSTRSFPATAR
ncbi:hypothetical protein B0H66DRAFT_627715 [Apodospora peruviana]|uniref:Peroxisomal membrane protein PEX14 n=1 Tax=Apodospora peruviana TaxID=516989 RepID=A0AAE0HY34_9PEZI|nr:hypothetical protein B0H66DRAFT_627715 [Apodospora peruviana]